MANYCDYVMKVVGDTDNVKEFVKIITDGYYDDPNNKYIGPHMYRIFEASVDDVEQYGLQSTVYLGGYCAWSVYCCMTNGEHSYYNDHMLFTAGNDGYGTHLLNESKRLHLFIEVASAEPGMCFGEYYRMNNGIMFEDTFKPYASIYPCCYDTLEECNNDIKNTNEEFDAEIPLLTKKQFIQYNKTGENYAEINECMEMFASTYYKDMCTSEMCSLIIKEDK